MYTFTESIVEQAAPTWLESLDHPILSGPEIAPRNSRKVLPQVKQKQLECQL